MAKLKSRSVVSSSPSFQEVKKWYHDNLHPDANNYDDPNVYKYVYHESRFAGIFQCTSSGAQKFFVRGKPESITDIAALTSIYRPGPLSAKVDRIYLDAKNGKKFEWGHPIFEEVLGDTYNALVFQESVMDLAEKVGGFPKDQCDNVRRAIMKRDHSKGAAAIKEMKDMEEAFVKGAMAKGIKEETAKRSYETICFMSGYGFNRCVSFQQLINIYGVTGQKDGTKKLKDVKPGDLVLSRDEKIKKNVLVKVKKVHFNGTKPLVRVTLKSGEVIECTRDHKFRVKETGQMLPLHEIIDRQLSIVVSS